MSKPLPKPSPDKAIAGWNGTFSLNKVADAFLSAVTDDGFNMVAIGHSETVAITELYVNHSPTNVADQYMLDVGAVLPKFELIIAKENEQFTGITWTGGMLALVR